MANTINLPFDDQEKEWVEDAFLVALEQDKGITKKAWLRTLLQQFTLTGPSAPNNPNQPINADTLWANMKRGFLQNGTKPLKEEDLVNIPEPGDPAGDYSVRVGPLLLKGLMIEARIYLTLAKTAGMKDRTFQEFLKDEIVNRAVALTSAKKAEDRQKEVKALEEEENPPKAPNKPEHPS